MSQKGKLNCSKQLELFSLCGTFHQTNRKSTETTNDTKPLSLNPLHFCHSNIEDNREKKSDYSSCLSKEPSILNPLLANTFVGGRSFGLFYPDDHQIGRSSAGIDGKVNGHSSVLKWAFPKSGRSLNSPNC